MDGTSATHTIRDHVVILRSIIATIRLGHRVDQGPPDSHEMNNIVLTEQKLGRICRLMQGVQVLKTPSLLVAAN